MHTALQSIVIRACVQLQHTYSIFLRLWHNTWTTQTRTVYTSSMTDNTSTHIINKDYFAYMNIKYTKVRLPSYSTFSINNVHAISAAVLYAGKYFRVVQRQGKGGDTYSPGFNIKWVLFPWFNPSLPLFLSPILPYLNSCLHTSLLLASYLAPSLRFPVKPPAASFFPCMNELHILHNKYFNSSTALPVL